MIMRRKKLIAVFATVLVLALAVPALAAVNNPPANPLTADQAREIAALHKQMLNIKKQMIDRLVEFGRLTPEQGEQAKQRITERQQYIEQNPEAIGWGNCPNYGGCWGRGGRGGWGGFGGMMGPRGGYGGP